jgi:5-methylcytosine-specific restriction endonuclease McrA
MNDDVKRRMKVEVRTSSKVEEQQSQEQQSHELESRVEELETRVVELKTRVGELEALVRNTHTPPNTKRRVSEMMKKRVACMQDWMCASCHGKLPACYEVDHTIPLWQGGSNAMNNLAAMCRNCHGMKTQNDLLGCN